MLKKIGNYYLAIIKKYGVIIPAILVSVAFLCLLCIDVFDGLRALPKGAFIALAVVAVLAVVAGGVYSVLKLKVKEIAVHDLVIACLAACCIPTLIMFCFTGYGSLADGLGFWKWVVTLVGLAICVALGVFRSKNLD